MASEVEICNRALQKLGAKLIVSLTQDSSSARACQVTYYATRDAELRSHPWNFAIKRAILALSATKPLFGRRFSFALPNDFLRILPTDPEHDHENIDWEIESGFILTNFPGPYPMSNVTETFTPELKLRYVARVTDPNQMDIMFREAVSARLAVELCEQITQSNPKKAALSEEYKLIISEARRVNGIENVARRPPWDEFLTCRR